MKQFEVILWDVDGTLLYFLAAEKAAINQYKMHISMINDDCVNDVLARIMIDEEYHIMLLQAMLKEC